MKDKSRSPLKDNPLRTPGESCEEKRRALWDDKLEAPLLTATAAMVMAILEWWRSYLQHPPQPVLITVLALGLVAWAALRFRKHLPEIRNLRQAAAGEKAVGQFLEKLRSEGYEVFHDIPANGFNVDHVILGPAGIYSIETKTWSKPKDRDAKIVFDGETLTAGGYAPDRDVPRQASAQAAWLSRLLEEGTGRKYAVKPVTLFPGWWVEQTEDSLSGVWVLEPKAFAKFLPHQPQRLKPEDIKLAAYHLSRYVRTFAAT